MTNKLRFLILCLVFSTNYSVASDLTEITQREKTLCKKGEDIYFSCPLESGKIISVCAGNNAASDKDYVEYRYGDSNDSFVYPRSHVHPADRFAISDISEGSIRGLNLKFENDRYTYVISSVWPGEVYVCRNGGIIFDQKCQESRYKNFSKNIFDKLRLVPPSDVDVH